MITFLDLPVDLLSPILFHLNDRKDWYTCCLVNHAFYSVAIPYLYRTLDCRTRQHPCSTLLRRPHLAHYVYHVTETGIIHRLGMLVRNPNLTREILSALALCINLRSLTWVDDSHSADGSLFKFLAVVRKLPLRELTIRTHADPSSEVWSQVMSISGLEKVSLCCTGIPSRVLLGWSGPLGKTLTHLELSRCSDAPTALITVFKRLPLLQHLRLRGASATTIVPLLSLLLNLRSLDTEFHASNSSACFSEATDQFFRLAGHDETTPLPILPVLNNVTVRTSFKGSQMLWKWICSLVPFPGLETFCLHAFSWSSDAEVPRSFIVDIAAKHRMTLRHFIIGDCYLALENVRWLFSVFEGLEYLECSVDSPDVLSIFDALSDARSLQTLKLRVRWLSASQKEFTTRDAMQLMLRSENSRLRSITINNTVFTGKWVADRSMNLRFQVVAEVVYKDNWLV